MDFSVLLAHDFNQEKDNIIGWHGSEKYDGIRFVFFEGCMYTRASKKYKYVPQSIIDLLPKDINVEGEIWAGRGNFNLVSRMYTMKLGGKYSKEDLDKIWNSVDIIIFDLPTNENIPYEDRIKIVKSKVKENNIVKVVQTFKIVSMDQLMKKYQDIIKKGGEGIMLRKPGSL